MPNRIVIDEGLAPNGADLVRAEVYEETRGTLRVLGLNLDIPLTITRTGDRVRVTPGPFANESGGTVPARPMRKRAA